MTEKPTYAPKVTDHFVSMNVFAARYHTLHQQYDLLVEVRKNAHGAMRVFTRIAGEDVRAASLHELARRSDCTALAVFHNVRVVWAGQVHDARLSEIFTPLSPPERTVGIQLELQVDTETYKTEVNETLSDASRELHALVGETPQWFIQTCMHCQFMYMGLFGPGWDDRDDLRCFRDDPEAFAAVQQHHKFAGDALYAGDYFVYAFHTCAAWQPPPAGRASKAGDRAPRGEG